MQKIEIGNNLRVVNADPLPGNEVAPPIDKNDIYPCLNIIEDSQGNQHIDIGIASMYNYIRSHETKEELPNGDKIHWCHPSRFEVVPN